jgi:hypothetical protein
VAYVTTFGHEAADGGADQSGFGALHYSSVTESHSTDVSRTL